MLNFWTNISSLHSRCKDYQFSSLLRHQSNLVYLRIIKCLHLTEYKNNVFISLIFNSAWYLIEVKLSS